MRNPPPPPSLPRSNIHFCQIALVVKWQGPQSLQGCWIQVRFSLTPLVFSMLFFIYFPIFYSKSQPSDMKILFIKLVLANLASATLALSYSETRDRWSFTCKVCATSWSHYGVWLREISFANLPRTRLIPLVHNSRGLKKISSFVLFLSYYYVYWPLQYGKR